MEKINLENIIDAFFTNYNIAPPFLRINQDGKYALVGQSDLANGDIQVYSKNLKGKLTPLNHTITLNEIMIFMKIVDKLSDENLLDFDDPDITSFLEQQLLKILSVFFDKDMSELKRFVTYEIVYHFVMNNKQLINEAIYNLTRDEEPNRTLTPQQLDESLDGTQFIDPYISIAYEVARIYKMRPYDIIANWSSTELLVAFTKISNDNSLNAYVSYKNSQKDAPKPRQPDKQVFYFEELDQVNSENEEGDDEDD